MSSLMSRIGTPSSAQETTVRSHLASSPVTAIGSAVVDKRQAATTSSDTCQRVRASERKQHGTVPAVMSAKMRFQPSNGGLQQAHTREQGPAQRHRNISSHGQPSPQHTKPLSEVQRDRTVNMDGLTRTSMQTATATGALAQRTSYTSSGPRRCLVSRQT